MDVKKIVFSIFLITILLMTVSGCDPEKRAQKRIDKELAQEINYTTFSNEGFSIVYPEWPAPEDKKDDGTVSATRGYCTVMINPQKMNARQFYDMMKGGIEQSEGEILIANEDDLRLKHSTKYLQFTMISDTRIYPCQGYANIVSIVCISDVNDKAQHIHEKVFGSALCEGSAEEVITYQSFKEEDYALEHPEWDELPEENEARVVGVTKGTCSVMVDKHNALPKDIVSWIEKSINDKEDHKLLLSSQEGDEYFLNYEFPLEDKYTLTSKTKVVYCNYLSYLTNVICINELMTEEMEEMREKVLENAMCEKEYKIPTPKVVEERKEEVKEEEPEIIEEIEDEIVKTNIGDEFGIDEEMVVYFINSNVFFTKILKDFPKGNLVFEDGDRDLKIKVDIGSDGKITLVEDGEHEDPSVTLFVPLRDALNILNNAENINPLTLLSFAVNVRTEPANIKNEVIQKVLRGEYN